MPTYLYECEKCGRFEEFQKITDEAMTECPNCDSSVKRIIGKPGIIFKGSGFYSTDSKTSSNVMNGQDKKTEETTDSVKLKKNDKKVIKTDSEAS